jgi:hypothetical protein
MAYLRFTDGVSIDLSGPSLLGKLFTIFFVLMFCGIAHSDRGDSVFRPSKEEILQLLRGERSIALVTGAAPGVRDALGDTVFSDIISKLRLIELEPTPYFLGTTPALTIDLDLLPTENDLYSGKIELTFRMAAEYRKGDVQTYATVWENHSICANVDERYIRSAFENMMDEFLDVYFVANPRTFVADTQEKKQQ